MEGRVYGKWDERNPLFYLYPSVFYPIIKDDRENVPCSWVLGSGILFEKRRGDADEMKLAMEEPPRVMKSEKTSSNGKSVEYQFSLALYG